MLKLSYYIKFIPKIILHTMHLISGICPRETNKWVFGAHFGFADNAKYFMIHIHENHPEIRTIWIAHKKNDIGKVLSLGLECYYWLSIKGFYHCMTSKVYVCTQNTIEINRFVTANAVYVNLNHGVGLKKCYWLRPDWLEKTYGAPIEYLEKSFVFKINSYPWYFRVPDICLVTSDFQADNFYKPMFRIKDKNCLFSQFPRNKVMLAPEVDRLNYIKKYEPKECLEFIKYLSKFNKKYIYMPTWRNDSHDFIKDAKIDFNALNTSLKINNDVLILCLHPYTKLDISYVSKFSNIIIFDRKIDVYTILPFTDCLITDYSSIYSDYLLLNKEIILYVFDLDCYLSKCTELGDYDKFYVGKKAYDFNCLLNIIANQEDCHISDKDKEFVMQSYWGRCQENPDLFFAIKERLFAY